MEKTLVIEFRDNISIPPSTDNESMVSFGEVECLPIDVPRKNSMGLKKFKSATKMEDKPKQTQLTILFQFNVSVKLLNLLRQPMITSTQDFDYSYLCAVSHALHKTMEQPQNRQTRITLYMHLILAQVTNLDEMQELGEEAFTIQPLSTAWNCTNIMNVECILENLKRVAAQSLQKVEMSKKESSLVQVVDQPDIFIFNDKDMQISRHYIELALQSHGHLDIYFGPFLINQFSFEARLRFFDCFKDLEEATHNYSDIYVQLVKEHSVIRSTDYSLWLKQHVDKLINGELQVSELQQLLSSQLGSNQHIERFLIGLVGWDKETDEAIKLLNVFYDNCDWQIHSQFKPAITNCGAPFMINYLIDKITESDSLLICLKAPCQNAYYNGECFSWHLPKAMEYITEEESYIWLQQDLGTFAKSGFYDWVLFQLRPTGKHSVNKIVDLQQAKPMDSSREELFANNVSVRSVKGRYIVHPAEVRQLQLHQIDIDSINHDQGLYKSSSFADAATEIQNVSRQRVNCVYLMGVFDRDTEIFQHVHKKPQASSLAMTYRAEPCQMLGGREQFKALMKRAHKQSTKVLVDVSARVSSSRMNKAYEALRLQALDSHGRKKYLYGSNGRSVAYDDTMMLNYRKKAAWDLLLQEIMEVVEKYGIDGIYLDNGFEWGQLYKVDSEEMNRKQKSTFQQLYSNMEKFEGEIVLPNKIAGYWSSKIRNKYPNPFLIRICKQLWNKYPNFLIVCEGLGTQQDDLKTVSIIRSGPIPRLFKMPKALSQLVGCHLHSNGQLSQTQAKTITSLRRWYEQVGKLMPRNAIIIHSTTSPIWPNPAYLFKKATWAIVDLFFFLPDLTMTFGLEHLGKAYRTKSVNVSFVAGENYERSEHDTKDKKVSSFNRINSTFFEKEVTSVKKGEIVTGYNRSLKQPGQLGALEEAFRKEVGPEFGFDLSQIYKHYRHRRELRKTIPLLTSGNLIHISAQHMYGVHTNVLSFAKYDEKEILLVSINFNSGPIDMHYNLTALRVLFKRYERANIIAKLEDLLDPGHFREEYYTVGELLSSRIEAHIDAYKSILWKLTVNKDVSEQRLAYAFKCSQNRMLERINRNPPEWIYSSVFFIELNYLLDKTHKKINIVNCLNKLYEQFIAPNGLNFSLVLSKSHEFYLHKNKLEKLFGVLKLVQDNPQINQNLKEAIVQLLSRNKLGPIAFVTPQIGQWSAIGGLGVMVDELSKQLAKLGEQVYVITPYYEYNKKNQTNYLKRDGFTYTRNVTARAAHFSYQFGIHCGKRMGVNYIWFHNPELFSKPYDGEGALYVSKQLVFFGLAALQSCCQLKVFPSIMITNDWMCGFVSAYVKCQKYKQVFDGTKFMHIVHNLDPTYEGRLYPKFEEGDLNWLIQLPQEWYLENRNGKLNINPSKCALQTCDNWGTVSNSYKYDLLRESPLAGVLWKHQQPFSFPNGVQKKQRLSIMLSKTPGNHLDSKKLIQERYFSCETLRNEIPLFSFIGRITRQKGVHLILDSIEALLSETNFKIQFLIAGPSDAKEEYGKYCADKMKYLTSKYPNCVWSNPQMFFTDGPLVNIGSDFAMMPSLFEPGGIVQHQFFCGGTPVVAFRTGGLKDTVFEYDMRTFKGNGFNFMSYELEDFKKCMRRAIDCYLNKEAYQKIRQNAFDSVIEEEDVAKGWNNEFYRLQNKIYIDWEKVENQVKSFKTTAEGDAQIIGNDCKVLAYYDGDYWRKQWDSIATFKEVLRESSRLKGKLVDFCFQTKKIPRPKDVFISGAWNDWKAMTKMIFDKIQKNYKVSLKLEPGTYLYKYVADNEWALTQNEEKSADINGIENHIITVE